jgi:hypothetical protein
MKRAKRGDEPHFSRYCVLVEMLRSKCGIAEFARELNCSEQAIREWAEHVCQTATSGEPQRSFLKSPDDEPDQSALLAEDDPIAVWLRGLT